MDYRMETKRALERLSNWPSIDRKSVYNRCIAIRQDRPIDVCIIRHKNIRTGWQMYRQIDAQADRCTKRCIKEQTGGQ
jgi:hypothetical protein